MYDLRLLRMVKRNCHTPLLFNFRTFKMEMIFSSDLPVTILFAWWYVDTSTKYWLSFVVCVCMGLLRQLLLWIRTSLVSANSSYAVSKDEDSLLQEDDEKRSHEHESKSSSSFFKSSFLQKNRFALRLIDLILFASASTLSFLNMLVVMTYNPGLMMAIVLGETIGVGLLLPLGGISHQVISATMESPCH
jgi:Ctr copper transporter family